LLYFSSIFFNSFSFHSLLFFFLSLDASFILKIFDAFSPFTAAIFYILHRRFHKVTIIKPVSSPSHHAERYIICKGYSGHQMNRELIKLLLKGNDQMNRVSKVSHENSLPNVVKSLVNIDTMLQDENFVDFLQGNNMK